MYLAAAHRTVRPGAVRTPTGPCASGSGRWTAWSVTRSPSSDRLDWVAKRALLADYVESEGVGWDDEALPSYDLAYSNIDPEEGLYYALEQSGEMQRLTTDEAIDVAQTQAPESTRAAIRGGLVARFAEKHRHHQLEPRRPARRRRVLGR